MRKLLIFLSACMLPVLAISFRLGVKMPSKIYTTDKGEVSFFSKAPIEDIDAHNRSMSAALNTRDQEFECVVPVSKFEFRLGKMQRDFNNRFMDTEKYPIATFTGKINEPVDFDKDGTYNVTVSGYMKIHGVSQNRTEKGTVTVKGNTVSIASNFKIRVKDFKVKIPILLTRHIAETVDVKVKADLQLNEKMTNDLLGKNHSL